MISTLSNETQCDSSTKKTCASGEVCNILDLDMSAKMTVTVEGANVTYNVEAKAIFSECSAEYTMTDEICNLYVTGYEAALSTDDEASFTDFDLDCGSVDACTDDCLISGSRSVIPATFVLIV